MGLPSSWPDVQLPPLPWLRADSPSPLLLASISETASGAGLQRASAQHSLPHAAHVATPNSSFTKIPSSLLVDSNCTNTAPVQGSDMNFIYKKQHASRMLHLPSEAALRLVEAVQWGVMTVQLGVLSSPPARHIQQLHNSLVAGQTHLQQDVTHAAHSRGLAILQALRLPQLLHLRRGEDKAKVMELADDPNKAIAQLHLQGLEYERARDLVAAAKCYEQASLLEPNNAEWLARWSKQITDRTYLPGTTEEEARHCNTEALQIAERALQLDPDCSLAHVAACISKGRLAIFSDNKSKVTLAMSAQENAVFALRLDPKSDLAHHLFGRWHYEMAGQNLFVRTLVKIIFGADLPPGTYHEALEAFQAAATLRPDRAIHWVEMGRAEVKLGKAQDAMEHLRLALTLDDEDVNAHQEKLIGIEILQQLEQEATRALPRW